MPFFPTRRLRLTIVDGDRAALAALMDLPNYRPHNPAHAREAVAVLGDALEQARQDETRAARTLAAARDATQAAEWALHDAMLGVKVEVAAQYGNNSNELQALGLKKKSDRKRPSRRSGSAPSAD
ncbi:hypothetical protein HC891_14965 [Candidatus Gracilibacteria bacterium]|nr:hypothetical protein [Candidatus Gracilibacteria bacterium]